MRLSIFIQLEVASSLEGKIKNGISNLCLTYVVEIVQVTITAVRTRNCMAIILTDLHVLAPAECIKDYEESYNKNKGPSCRLISYISVLFKQNLYDIVAIRTSNKYRSGDRVSYNIGIVTVSYLTYHKV